MKTLQRLQQTLLFVLLSIAAFGQAPTMPNTVPYENHGAYTINLQNLTVGVNLPIREKSGANEFSASYTDVLNSLDSAAGFVKPSVMTTRADSLTVNGLVGRRVSVWYTTRTDTGQPCTNHNILNWVKLTGWYVITADGALHPLPSTILMDENMCYHSAFSNQLTLDGSGYSVSFDMAAWTANVVSPNGATTGSFSNGLSAIGSLAVTDSNGNIISANSGYTTYTDTLGQPALTSTGGSTVPTYSWLDSSGTNYQHVVFTTTSKTQSTSWGCGAPYADHTYAAAPFLTKVAYPDSTNLLLSYETSSGGITGRIGGITLRTGGVVSFGYTGINCGSATKRATTSQMTQTIGGKQWRYTYTSTTTGNTTTVVDPAGNQTIYTFVSSANGPVIVQSQRYQGTTTILSSTLYCYNGNSTNCTTTFVSLPLNEIDVYTTLGTMTTSSRTKQTFDAYGNVLTSAVYGFGDTTPKFTTTTTYGGCGTSLVSKPCDVLTSDGTNTVTESRATYDALGNRLTSSSWTGTTWLGSSATYNGNGTTATTTAVDGTQTTLTYDGSCNSAFPTKSQVGGLATYASWDCSGGVQLTSTDVNGYVKTYSHTDPFWRVTSVADSALPGTTASIAYTPTTVEKTAAFGVSTQDTVSTVDGYGRPIRTQTKHGSQYDTVTTKYDEIANTLSTSAPCTVALGADCAAGFTVATLDATGRNSSTADGGGATITTTYPKQDMLTVLGPAPSGEHTKQFQKEYDGLGRVLSSCTILSAGGSSCGQVTTGSGNVTTFGYSTAAGSSTTTATRGAQTRTTVKDALGRVVSQTDPESGATTYAYDTLPAACNGQSFSRAGTLMYVKYANGNYDCYENTSFGRVIGITGNSGSGAPAVCRRFYYDGSTGVLGVIPTGITPTNPNGRMVEAESDTCAWPVTQSSVLTDEWFGYDTKGNITDVWQKTPHSGSYYHSSASYFPNGQLASATIPSLGTVTYALDGDGKSYSAVQGSLNLVSSVTYSPVGPTTINIGSGSDHDTYGYDAVGRMHTFQFFVGTKNALGTLNWSANGTLGSLNVVDGFSATNTQTCTFAYDDAARLTSDQCGGPWAQTFAYDQYDNLNQYGSAYNNLSYDPNTNRYTNGATTYDAAGNLTSDGTNTFAYDAFNKMSSAIPIGKTCANSFAAACLTMDAFGNAVEIQNSGGYYQMIYGPLGKTAGMFGQTLQYAYVPLPGGGLDLYYNGAHNYTHKDWLGSGRTASSIPASGSGTIYYDRSFAPYGQMYGNSGTPYSQDFTGDTQDLYSGLFDTPNREYAQGQGRWLTPDPAHAGWNLYAYGTDPNSSTDPSGLSMCCWGGEQRGNGGAAFNPLGSGSVGGGIVIGTVVADFTGEGPAPAPPSFNLPSDCGGIIICGQGGDYGPPRTTDNPGLAMFNQELLQSPTEAFLVGLFSHSGPKVDDNLAFSLAMSANAKGQAIGSAVDMIEVPGISIDVVAPTPTDLSEYTGICASCFNPNAERIATAGVDDVYAISRRWASIRSPRNPIKTSPQFPKGFPNGDTHADQLSSVGDGDQGPVTLMQAQRGYDPAWMTQMIDRIMLGIKVIYH